MGNLHQFQKTRNFRDLKGVFDLIKSTFTSGTAAGLAQLFMVVYTLLAARFLRPDSYGVMAACYAATALTSFLINWGLDSWLLKSASLSSSPLQLAGGVLHIKFIAGLMWGLILWLLLPALRPDLYIPSILFLVLVDTLFDSLTNVIYVTLTVTNRIPAASGLLLSNRIFRLVSLVPLVFFGISDLGTIILLRMLVTVVSFAVGLMITKPGAHDIFVSSKRDLARQTAPFAFSEILTLGYFQIDTNLVSAFAGDKTLVGNYSIVISVINAVTAVIASINNVLLPVLTRIYQRRSKNFFRITLLTCGCFVLLGGILWVGFGISGEEIVRALLGKDYLLAGIYLRAIAPLFLLRALSLTISMLLVVVNMQNERLLPQAFAVAIKTVGGIWAFPKWHVIGIIQVYIISELMMVIGYLVLVYRWYRKSWLYLDHKSSLI